MARPQPRSKPAKRAKPFTPVEQPETAYPRFYFDFVFCRPHRVKPGKFVRIKWPAAAYSTRLAELQAANLAKLRGWEVVAVNKGKRLAWHEYYAGARAVKPAWWPQYLQDKGR